MGIVHANEITVDEILKELAPYSGKFPESAVKAAVARREAITPALIAALEEVIEHAGEYANRGDYMLQVYALFLLAQFREKKAFPVAIKLISLPDDLPDGLLGEMTAAGLAGILASLFDGDLETLVKVSLQHNAYPYVRSSVMDAIVLLFIEGSITREQMLGAFGRLFKELTADDDCQAWNGLVNCVGEAQAHELLPEVRKAFADNRVEEGYVTLDEVKKNLAEDPKKLFAAFRAHDHLITDTVAEMSWWAAFDENEGKPDETPEPATTAIPFQRETPKISRNDPCPCGSGKKFKKCCMK